MHDHSQALWGLLFFAAGMFLPAVVGLVSGLFQIAVRSLHVRVATGRWPSQSERGRRMYLDEDGAASDAPADGPRDGSRQASATA